MEKTQARANYLNEQVKSPFRTSSVMAKTAETKVAELEARIAEHPAEQRGQRKRSNAPTERSSRNVAHVGGKPTLCANYLDWILCRSRGADNRAPKKTLGKSTKSGWMMTTTALEKVKERIVESCLSTTIEAAEGPDHVPCWPPGVVKTIAG